MDAEDDTGLDLPPRRPAAERFHRIWALVEDIAREPGQSRRGLAQRYAISERQLQDDLGVIRHAMGLPLVRRRGYRFVADDQDNAGAFSLAEAQLLLLLVRRAARDPSIPPDRLRTLLAKLPCLFPAHLRPVAARTLQAAGRADGGRQHEIFAAVADALLSKASVRLHFTADEPPPGEPEPILRPELLLPYLDSWYLVGTSHHRGRRVIFDLEHVVAVERASGL